VVIATIGLAAVVGFLAVFAVWAKRQLLETDTWAETSTELLEDEEIRTAVSGYLVDTLFSEVDVDAELQQALPPRAARAAGPIAGAIRRLADDLALRALERPRVQELWEEANREAQSTLLALVEEGGSEPVTLDVGTLVDQLGDQVGFTGAAEKLPPEAAEIVILDNDELVAAQDAVDLLETLAWVVATIALLLFSLAIYLAEGWRREALRDVGFAFIAVGVAVLVARGVAGNYLTDQLASTASVEPAAANTWEIGTSLLAEGGGAMIFYGIAVVLGAWLASPIGVGRSIRRELAPVLERRGIAYAVLAALLLFLFWWAPTPGFERLLPSLVLIALLVAGLETLRAQARRHFPDETWEAGTGRWRARAHSLLARRRERTEP
jgi:hypothetical protein